MSTLEEKIEMDGWVSSDTGYRKESHYEVISGTEGAYVRDDVDRKSMPVYTGVLKYFPKALKYVSRVSKFGNNQHHPEKPLHWDKSKSFDHEDALVRHLIDHSCHPMDDDNILHLGKVAWRALAALEMYLESATNERI
jgi:ribosomal protein L31